MRKLVFLTDTFPPDLCGVADYTDRVASELSNNYEVHVITRKGTGEKVSVKGGVTVHETLRGKSYILKAAQQIKAIQADIVDVQLAYSNASCLHQQNLLTIINPVVLRSLTRSAKYCLTIHELSTYLSDCPSRLRAIYRALRDYGQTRLYDHYFCVSQTYLDYLQSTKNKTFLPSFSNIPTVRSHNRIENRNLLYFGTIGPNKFLRDLFQTFQALYERDSRFHLYIVGGIVADYQDTFFRLVEPLPISSWTYKGRLEAAELEPLLNNCSYALYPFPVSDKNASVIAMLTNQMVVIAVCKSVPFYAASGNNFRALEKMQPDAVQSVVASTLGCQTLYPDNEKFLANHITQRREIYESLLSTRH